MTRLDGKVALVTGAAKGLGAGIARRLASDGAAVICADVLDAAGVVDDLPTGDHAVHRCATIDVSDTAAVEALVAQVLTSHGRIDVLVNNAAVMQPLAAVIDTPEEVVERVLAVNLRGTIACSRAVGRAMRDRGSGRIVNISSQAGKSAWPGHAVYAASKAAVIALTQGMGLELAPHGVIVNCICPGSMATDQMRGSFADIARRDGRDRDELIAEKAASMPLGRLGTPEDAASLVAWLASDDASFSVGAAFNLTGGESVGF
jgi:NAD(P)-dependent dehydrogenase (short-subunit alcohol dehydrogenase family)